MYSIDLISLSLTVLYLPTNDPRTPYRSYLLTTYPYLKVSTFYLSQDGQPTCCSTYLDSDDWKWIHWTCTLYKFYHLKYTYNDIKKFFATYDVRR